jgi:hypothetical protein
MLHLPRNSRPSADLPHYGMPPLVLLAACRADPRWPERAAAVEDALAFEPPCPAGQPVPIWQMPRHEAIARIGAYGRWLEARRLEAKVARREADRGGADKIDAGPPAEAAGERSDPPPHSDAQGELVLLGTSPDFPGKSAYKPSKFSPHKRQLGGPRIVAAKVRRRARREAA